MTKRKRIGAWVWFSDKSPISAAYTSKEDAYAAATTVWGENDRLVRLTEHDPTTEAELRRLRAEVRVMRPVFEAAHRMRNCLAGTLNRMHAIEDVDRAVERAMKGKK